MDDIQEVKNKLFIPNTNLPAATSLCMWAVGFVNVISELKWQLIIVR
jgi:hypothetical protein